MEKITEIISSRALTRLESVYARRNTGMLILQMNHFYVLAETYGIDDTVRMFDMAKKEAETVFHMYFQDCSIILTESAGLNEWILFFQPPYALTPEFHNIVHSFRLTIRRSVRAKLELESASHFDILAGYSWMKRNTPDDFAGAFLKAYCEAHQRLFMCTATGGLQLHREFLDVLDQKRLTAVYQPVINMADQRIVGWEGFIRGPEKSFFHQPVHLFSHAREYGMIQPLETICLERLMQGFRPKVSESCLFINICHQAFDNFDHLSKIIRRSVSESGMEPGSLVFELSEASCIDHYDKAIEITSLLKKHRYRVSLDDIGGQDMGMKRLTRLRPDFVKLDKSLTAAVTSSPISRVMTESYVKLSKECGFTVIGKCLETAGELKHLAEQGVYMFQGRLLAEPSSGFPAHIVPPDSVTDMQANVDGRSRSGPAVFVLVQQAVDIPPDATVQEINHVYGGHAPLRSFVIVESGKPAGLLMKYNLDRHLGTKYGISLFYKREVARLMDSAPLVVDSETSLEDVIRLAMNRERQKIYDDVIVTGNGELMGTVSVQKMLETMVQIVKKERDAARADNEKIKDSIRYAKLIQESLLPSTKKRFSCLPNHFLIWMPRDIVGGDIFLLEQAEHGFVIAVVDCTGHGVPGAFMTMITSVSLKRIVKDEKCANPAEILARLNVIVKTTLRQDTEDAVSDDGLEAAVCHISPPGNGQRTLTFSGARIPLVYCQGNTPHIVKPDRKSIGYVDSEMNAGFTNRTVYADPDMRFYLYTDGYADQMGGSDRFPFGGKRLIDVFARISGEPFEAQQKMLIDTFMDFKGENDRQDDVTVFGFSLEQ